MRSFLLAASFAWLGTASACTKSTESDERPSAVTTTVPDAGPTAEQIAYARAIQGRERWTSSSSPCPIHMTAMPTAKYGENLGELGLREAPSDSLDVAVVRSFAEGKPPGGGPSVYVLYVETSRTDPAADLSSGTFTAGASQGTAYVFDRVSGKFACLANVKAASSPSVTTLKNTDRNAKMWLTIDLMGSIEREIVANARAIATTAEAIDGGRDAGARPVAKPKR